MGCDFGASSKVASVDTGDGASDGDDADLDDSGDLPTDDPDPSEVDDDEDGYTESDGDCDDQDASVHPGATDGCDGIDTDCDGVVDDAAESDDPYEPNDGVDYYIGSLNDQAEHSISAFLHDDGDIDRFSFEFDDGVLDFFTLRVGLSGIASGTTYKMVLEHVDTGDKLYEDFNESSESSLEFEVGDGFLSGDGGTYRVIISSLSGASCANAYLLSISLDTLWPWD